MVQLSHPYMPPGKVIALPRWTFVSKSKVVSMLFFFFKIKISQLWNKHIIKLCGSCHRLSCYLMTVETSLVLNSIRLILSDEKWKNTWHMSLPFRGRPIPFLLWPGTGLFCPFLTSPAASFSSSAFVCISSSPVLCQLEFNSYNYTVGLIDRKRSFLADYFSLEGDHIYCFN